ncbi:putative pyridoxal kinase [Actinomortierella wolfii]|nr:putative pyridoxal kinase [Actinomortierella wolfii]
MSSPRVLSIQSHMVSGYCGNKAATFPLQLLGFDVDVINTVNFSNHTGYPSWTGERANAKQLVELLDGIESNNLDDYSHILTGYIGSAENLTAVSKIISRLKSKSDPFFVLDPVMGDNGELYVQPDVIPVYRDMMKIAKAITPNQFEAEVLTGIQITSWDTCKMAIQTFHDAGVENVVLTSVALPVKEVEEHAIHAINGGLSDSHSVEDGVKKPTLYCVCSSREGDEKQAAKIFAISFPTYDGYFTGTGDLFSALLVARLEEALRDNQPSDDHALKDKGLTALARACIKVIGTMNAVVLRTYLAQKGLTGGPGFDRTQASAASIVKQCELRLIQSKKDIEHPNIDGVEAIELV